ncbi:unnamed protein product [Leuciscus chuanchicus]
MTFFCYGLPGGRALAVVGAGPFPERGEERGLYLMIETINLQGLSQDHAVVHDPMVGSENCSSPALKLRVAAKRKLQPSFLQKRNTGNLKCSAVCSAKTPKTAK